MTRLSMEFVAEHPGWETEPFELASSDDYVRFYSLADLFRQYPRHVWLVDALPEGPTGKIVKT